MHDRFGRMDERAGWVGGSESGSKLPHSKTFRESGCHAGHRAPEPFGADDSSSQGPRSREIPNPRSNMNDGFGQMDERAGWVGGPESGSKLPHSKTLRESSCRACHWGRNGAEFTIGGREFPRTDKVSDLIGNSELVLGVGEERVVNMWMGYLPILADKKSFWRSESFRFRCGKFQYRRFTQMDSDGKPALDRFRFAPIRVFPAFPHSCLFVFIRG